MKGLNINMINDFHGDYFFLSNFYESPFWYKGRQWKTVEHAFQADKCMNLADYDKIHKAETPGEAKRIGRKVTLIPGWDYKRIDVMRECLLMKFLQNDELVEKLLNTEDELLVEGNTWHDNDWGECSCEKCAGKPGRNMLGQMLMEIRENIREDNYIWVAIDTLNGGGIAVHFKTRERALAWIAERPDCDPKHPYDAYGYRLSVVTLQ